MVFASLRHCLIALGVTGGLAVATACSSTPAAKVERLCTPDAWVYCRCQNRDEGSKQCNEDGTKFGPCMPCESPENPVLPDPPGTVEPPPEEKTDSGPPAVCGDKIVQDGEACDDGNTDDADGCDAKCRIAGTDPPATRSCPGLPLHVWSTPVDVTGTTVGAPNQFEITPSCPSDQGNVPTRGAAAPERVYSVTVHKGGVLVVTTTDASFDTFLFAMQPCKTGTTQAPAPYLTCTNKNGDTKGETLELPVQAGQTYAIVVDGAGINAQTGGTYRVTFAMK